MVTIERWTFEKILSPGDNPTFVHKEYSYTDDIDERGLFCARLRGSLHTLFGEPNYDSKELDDGVYWYEIKCIDTSNSSTERFSVTEHRLGPVLYGSESDNSKLAGVALWNTILTTTPADYKAKYYDDENTLKVYYGCKKSVPYFDLRAFNPFDYLRFIKAFFYIIYLLVKPAKKK
jgi:hypothetical protein